MYFEAVVVQAPQQPLIQALARLDAPDDRVDELLPITLKMHQVGHQRYVIFGWRAGQRRPDCAGEVESLAEELSFALAVPTVAVHYDDQCGPLKVALLVRNGEPVCAFGSADEVWVPYGEDGELVLDGPRYTGETVPDDVECDCIRNGIDAAIEAAGFAKWLTMKKLYAVAYDEKGEVYPLVWERLGTPRNPGTAAGA